MKKMKKLGMAVATATALMCSSNVFAAADAAGDSLINLPLNDSTVTSGSVDIWFGQITGASGYTVDLVGAATTAAAIGAVGARACDNAATANRTYARRVVLTASGLDCGQETAATKPGDGDLADVHLCKWTAPDLADGDYAIAINPIFSGDATLYGAAELRTVATCNADDAVAVVANVSLGAYADNTARTTLVAAAAGAPVLNTSDASYQRFRVAAGAGSATAIPTTPVPLLPAAGTALPSITNILTFVDNSGANNLATWYELWIYDNNNKRINTFNDNPTFKHWYKNTVDSELVCTTTNALGNRLCTIDLSGSIPVGGGTDADGGAVVATGNTLTWWVKGYNSLGATMWSSPATFNAN